MTGRLDGKVAIVTGGRQGIGRGIVDTFVDQGARVITCGRGLRPADLADPVVWQQTDMARADEVENLKQILVDNFGTLDILVNNAGVQIEKPVTETSDEDWEALMGVNAKGGISGLSGIYPDDEFRRVDYQYRFHFWFYRGSWACPLQCFKAFVHGLTRSIAVDHGPEIRCNAICPGWIMTGMADAAFELSGDPAAAKKDALARHAAGRFGRPQDIANMALWLASDESAFATGQLFTIDGGLTAASPVNTGLF